MIEQDKNTPMVLKQDYKDTSLHILTLIEEFKMEE